jgi:hypothetical protein
MSYTTEIGLDLGDLGWCDIEVTYDGCAESAGGSDEPPTDAQFYIESAKLYGVDIFAGMSETGKKAFTKLVKGLL